MLTKSDESHLQGKLLLISAEQCQMLSIQTEGNETSGPHKTNVFTHVCLYCWVQVQGIIYDNVLLIQALL